MIAKVGGLPGSLEFRHLPSDFRQKQTPQTATHTDGNHLPGMEYSLIWNLSTKFRWSENLPHCHVTFAPRDLSGNRMSPSLDRAGSKPPIPTLIDYSRALGSWTCPPSLLLSAEQSKQCFYPYSSKSMNFQQVCQCRKGNPSRGRSWVVDRYRLSTKIFIFLFLPMQWPALYMYDAVSIGPEDPDRDRTAPFGFIPVRC